jgi:biopolymer transport protein ExbD
MSKRHHYRNSRRSKEAPDLNITTFLNLMVVLVPFLLIGAVFSRVAILELSVPTAAGGSAVVQPNFTIEVIVRKAGLELANGASVVAAFPKKDDQYDMEKLSEILLRLKSDYQLKDDATILMEPDIEYDYLIRIMDAMREGDIPADAGGEARKIALFPKISIGDAP